MPTDLNAIDARQQVLERAEALLCRCSPTCTACDAQAPQDAAQATALRAYVARCDAIEQALKECLPALACAVVLSERREDAEAAAHWSALGRRAHEALHTPVAADPRD